MSSQNEKDEDEVSEAYMPERYPPWTMRTIREVIDTMRMLIESEDCELDTPIVWYSLRDGELTRNEHECCHVFHDDDGSWVELTIKDPWTDADGYHVPHKPSTDKKE